MGSQQRKHTIRKAMVITFLLLLIVGFTAPLILYSTDDPFAEAPQAFEPRVCRSDAECGLSCEGESLPILCLQNYCMQNTCEEYNPYAYTTPAVEFTLEAFIQGQPVTWQVTPGDSFISINGDAISIFTTDLTVRDIASKLGLPFREGCLFYNNVDYCSNENTQVQIIVNGNSSLEAERYIPLFGDNVQIVYD